MCTPGRSAPRSGSVYCPVSLTAPATARLLRPQGGGRGLELELGSEAAFLLQEQPEGGGLGAEEGVLSPGWGPGVRTRGGAWCDWVPRRAGAPGEGCPLLPSRREPRQPAGSGHRGGRSRAACEPGLGQARGCGSSGAAFEAASPAAAESRVWETRPLTSTPWGYWGAAHRGQEEPRPPPAAQLQP